MNLPLFLTRTPWLTASVGFGVSVLAAITLALFGVFFPWLTFLSLALILSSFGIALYTLFQSKELNRLILIALLTILSFIIATHSEPSIFTGRDQGSIGLAAWNLADNHELAFRSPVSDAFFSIYGPGRALNFPGFAYTETGALITQFPLGYTSFLAVFVEWFGLSGFQIGNAFLFIFSGWTFFELVSLFVTKRTAYMGTALFATSFLPLWLTELALTENLALFLYLALAVSLTQVYRDNDARFIPLVILLSFLFLCTRIEGFVIGAIVGAILILTPRLRQSLLTLPKKWTILALLSLGFLMLRDIFINLPFYTVIGKAALRYWQGLTQVNGGLATSDPALGPILFSYGLFLIFLLGIGGLLFGLMKRRFTLLIPFLLAAPTLIYLINGHISDDHPWLLRRYAFTLFPLLLLSTLCLLESIEERMKAEWKRFIIPIAFLILFAFQIIPAWQSLKTHEYDGLLEQSRYLGTLFTERDLLLIDRTASGDPFALLSGPLASLLRKNAVYFFNPEDYARIDRSGFDRVYLITGEDSLGRYLETFGDKLLPVQTISFHFPTLTAPKPYSFPKAVESMSDTLIFQITE